jgi:hypothetical protein
MENGFHGARKTVSVSQPIAQRTIERDRLAMIG